MADVSDEPLIAEHPEVPAEHALQGFHAVRAFASDPERSRKLLEEGLGFKSTGEGWEARGDERGGLYFYDAPPAERGIQGAGTVHHVAWNSADEDHEAWRDRVAQNGAHPTPVIDRHYFKSIYFREPSGVLFELATPSPGFTIDEPLETLGEKLSIPPKLEQLRPNRSRRPCGRSRTRARPLAPTAARPLDSGRCSSPAERSERLTRLPPSWGSWPFGARGWSTTRRRARA